MRVLHVEGIPLCSLIQLDQYPGLTLVLQRPSCKFTMNVESAMLTILLGPELELTTGG